MKVFISVDMEGVSGLVRWADVSANGIDFERNRVLMTEDANAAIEGAFQAGASEVVVEENHGVEDLCVLRMDLIDSRADVIRGAGRGGSTTMSGLLPDCGVVLLIGHHARAGSKPGIMAHTVSGSFRLVRLNGHPAGETDLFTVRAGEMGVPVGLVSGDQVVANQLRARLPGVETVILKQALSNSAARCISPARARSMIEEASKYTVERAISGKIPVFEGEPVPYEIEVEFWEELSTDLRANLQSMKEFEILDSKTVGMQAADMDMGFRRIAYLGYGDRLGLTKY